MPFSGTPHDPTNPTHRTRVLVVEDECVIRMVVSDHLRDVGFLVTEAMDGDEAIAILTSGLFIDLVYTDVRMPGVADGMDVLRFVRRTQPDLPVLMTSAHLEPAIAYSGGACGYLAKPTEPEAISVAIRAALDLAA
ncbi:response regulator [Brevundimonas sp. LM2]|uniref:response regulator n=1 Tax=Brevundimonas sp. LM2 TaxID=1938605 RepID=UPI0009838E0F|nr:response regulator [Brevundimonas sp. LM2]AQR60971.1 response regulator [Brevundimonas sp. LM2]